MSRRPPAEEAVVPTAAPVLAAATNRLSHVLAAGLKDGAATTATKVVLPPMPPAKTSVKNKENTPEFSAYCKAYEWAEPIERPAHLTEEDDFIEYGFLTVEDDDDDDIGALADVLDALTTDETKAFLSQTPSTDEKYWFQRYNQLLEEEKVLRERHPDNYGTLDEFKQVQSAANLAFSKFREEKRKSIANRYVSKPRPQNLIIKGRRGKAILDARNRKMQVFEPDNQPELKPWQMIQN